MAQAYITLAQLKVLLSITDTTQDVLLTALLPIAKDDMITWTNNPFVDEDGLDDWPLGTQIVIAQMIRDLLTNLAGGRYKSESEGGYSYVNEDVSDGYSKTVIGLMRKYQIASLVKGTITTQWQDRRWTSLKQLAHDFAYRNEPNVAYSNQNL
jgi:hypothetical protein